MVRYTHMCLVDQEFDDLDKISIIYLCDEHIASREDIVGSYPSISDKPCEECKKEEEHVDKH